MRKVLLLFFHHRECRWWSYRWNDTTMALIFYQMCMTMVSVAWQWYQDAWLYSTTMLYTAEGHLAFDLLMESLLWAPLREEFLFRLLLFSLMSRHASTNMAMLGTNGLFALYHLLNLIKGTLSPLYIVLQVGVSISIYVQNTQMLR